MKSNLKSSQKGICTILTSDSELILKTYMVTPTSTGGPETKFDKKKNFFQGLQRPKFLCSYRSMILLLFIKLQRFKMQKSSFLKNNNYYYKVIDSVSSIAKTFALSIFLIAFFEKISTLSLNENWTILGARNI